MMVLLEVQDSSKPRGKHWSHHHSTGGIKVVADRHSIESRGARKDWAHQWKATETGDVKLRLQDCFSMEASIYRLAFCWRSQGWMKK
jgi:hypothetical protein